MASDVVFIWEFDRNKSTSCPDDRFIGPSGLLKVTMYSNLKSAILVAACMVAVGKKLRRVQ